MKGLRRRWRRADVDELRERATSVVAEQQDAEQRLDDATVELEKVRAHEAEALRLVDRALAAGDEARRAEHTLAARSFAGRREALEREVDELRSDAVRAAGASGDAIESVRRASAD